MQRFFSSGSSAPPITSSRPMRRCPFFPGMIRLALVCGGSRFYKVQASTRSRDPYTSKVARIASPPASGAACTAAAALPPVCARLVDEWLQARNELSASKFFAGHPVGELTPSSAPEGFYQLRHQGESSTPLPPCVTPALVDSANLRHPSIHPAIAPGGCARLSGSSPDPLIDLLRQPGPAALPRE
jgi:hypothetical protein